MVAFAVLPTVSKNKDQHAKQILG